MFEYKLFAKELHKLKSSTTLEIMDKLFPVFDKSFDLKSRANLSGTIGQNLFLLLTEDLQIKAKALSR